MSQNEKNIYITTNVQCNLRCIYCYEDKSGNEVFDMNKAKALLKKELSDTTDGSVIINLHGGEPFLVFDMIKELCEWTWQQNFPKPHTFYTTTNGTKVHGRIKEWLQEHKHHFIAGLSLDGTREMQNINRSNSFDLIDIDFFVNTWPTQGVKMTVSPLSINTLADGVKFLFSKGISRVDANLAYMVDWNKPELIKIYYRELTKLSNYFKENPEKRKKCSIFDKNFHTLNLKDAQKRRWCGAGIETEAYNIDGKKYPCHLFFENVCGKEKSENCHDLGFGNPDIYIQGECRTCPIYPICPTCYGANFIERDHIGLRDMNLCRMEKVRTLVVAKHLYNMIVNSTEDNNELSSDELNTRLDTLDGLKKILPALEEYQKMVDNLL